MLRWRPLALGVASSLALVASAGAQQAGGDRVATAEPPPAATQPAPAAAPAPTPTDPIGIALQERLAAADKREDGERTALTAFYTGRIYAPLWVDTDGLNAKAKAAIAEIGKAGDWGLDAKAFALPEATTGGQPSADTLAELELMLSLAVLKYASHARGGRIPDPASDLSSYLDRKPQLIEPGEVMRRIAQSNTPDATLRGFHPQHPQFERLRQQYLRLREATAAAEVLKLAPGPQLTPGKSDPQIAILRKRLKVPATGTDPGAETLYDDPLKAAVVAFQKENGLGADGIVGNATRAALNDFEVVSPQKLIANMEQWRWMPDDLGSFYVWVNVPEFTVRVVKGRSVVHAERVITGLTDKQTPVFSETLKTIVFRPRWNVPNSIKVRELYPSLARGGQYFDRQGLVLSRNGRAIDPYSVDWGSADIRQFDVYQPGGEGNVLGEVKFAFPNKHDVYMHDTPTKNLFERTSRTFSHGCVRVRNPLRLAEVLLGEDKGWQPPQVAGEVAKRVENNEVQMTRPVPVHITYFTAIVDNADTVQVTRDVYGHEQRITLALEGQWSRIAKGPNHLAPVRLDEVRSDGWDWGWGGGGGRRRGGNTVGDYIQSVLGGF